MHMSDWNLVIIPFMVPGFLWVLQFPPPIKLTVTI